MYAYGAELYGADIHAYASLPIVHTAPGWSQMAKTILQDSQYQSDLLRQGVVSSTHPARIYIFFKEEAFIRGILSNGLQPIWPIIYLDSYDNDHAQKLYVHDTVGLLKYQQVCQLSQQALRAAGLDKAAESYVHLVDEGVQPDDSAHSHVKERFGLDSNRQNHATLAGNIPRDAAVAGSASVTVTAGRPKVSSGGGFEALHDSQVTNDAVPATAVTTVKPPKSRRQRVKRASAKSSIVVGDRTPSDRLDLESVRGPKGRRLFVGKNKNLSPSPQAYEKACERPSGLTKKDTDTCMTCIHQRRSCKGTQLVLVKGKIKCQCCAYKGNGTGGRICHWRDAARGIFTYEDAQKAPGARKCEANTRVGKEERARKRLAEQYTSA